MGLVRTIRLVTMHMHQRANVRAKPLQRKSSGWTHCLSVSASLPFDIILNGEEV